METIAKNASAALMAVKDDNALNYWIVTAEFCAVRLKGYITVADCHDGITEAECAVRAFQERYGKALWIADELPAD